VGPELEAQALEVLASVELGLVLEAPVLGLEVRV
jgi:hypothetical protein